jgi:hypothetical protein
MESQTSSQKLRCDKPLNGICNSEEQSTYFAREVGRPQKASLGSVA